MVARHFRFTRFIIKSEARKKAAIARASAHAAVGELAPLRLAQRGLPVRPEASRCIVSGFYPYKSEIDVRPLLGKLAGEGWETALPVVLGQGRPLEFRRWLPGEPTISGIWDIPRPPEDAAIVDPDVLLVPMLAFDRKGYRLGYGGGFYDRTLAKLRALKPIVAVGVAYAAQGWEEVPHEAHDQPLDFIMTEAETFACA